MTLKHTSSVSSPKGNNAWKFNSLFNQLRNSIQSESARDEARRRVPNQIECNSRSCCFLLSSSSAVLCAAQQQLNLIAKWESEACPNAHTKDDGKEISLNYRPRMYHHNSIEHYQRELLLGFALQNSSKFCSQFVQSHSAKWKVSLVAQKASSLPLTQNVLLPTRHQRSLDCRQISSLG